MMLDGQMASDLAVSRSTQYGRSAIGSYALELSKSLQCVHGRSGFGPCTAYMHSMSGLPNVYMLSSRVPDEADPVLGAQRAFFEHFATSRWEEHLLLSQLRRARGHNTRLVSARRRPCIR
jgi:hypothetical protein